MTTAQIHVMTHALGASQTPTKLGERNYFVTDADDPDCVALVDLGMMIPYKNSYIPDGERLFRVTDKGKAFLRSILEGVTID